MSKSQLQIDLKDRIRQGMTPYSPLYSCTWCQRMLDSPGTVSPLEATKDHPQPRSRGGKGNTVWACWTCNQIKYDMPYDSWKLYMSMHPRWWNLPHTRTFPRSNQKEQEDNVVPLRRKAMFEPKLITGGQPPSSGNWLMDLPIGTRFTVKMRTKTENFMCLDLELVNKTSRTAMLYELSTGQPFGGNGRVDPARFTMQFDFVEKLPSLEEMLEALPQETIMENNNGHSDRASESDS